MIGVGIGLPYQRRGGSAIAGALATRAGISWRPERYATTLFTDTAGTVPATQPGDIIAVMKDPTLVTRQFQQTTLANRPILVRHPKRGRVNLLVGSATMSTQNVTTTAAQHTLSIMGTGTVTLTGTSTAGPLIGTGAGNRVSLTFTPTAGALTLTVSGSVTSAQLQLGAAFDSLQTVSASGYDITETGQRDCWGLQGDNANDGMATTATVDAAGNNKVAVFLGAMRGVSANPFLSGVEFSPAGARWDTANGSFIMCPTGALNTNIFFDSRGTIDVGPQATGQGTPPNYVVMTGVSHIGGPNLKIRANGAQVFNDNSTQGTGNYGNHTVSILDTPGAAADSGINFGGAVVFGLDATTDATLIAAIEREIAQNTPGVSF